MAIKLMWQKAPQTEKVVYGPEVSHNTLTYSIVSYPDAPPTRRKEYGWSVWAAASLNYYSAPYVS